MPSAFAKAHRRPLTSLLLIAAAGLGLQSCSQGRSAGREGDAEVLAQYRPAMLVLANGIERVDWHDVADAAQSRPRIVWYYRGGRRVDPFLAAPTWPAEADPIALLGEPLERKTIEGQGQRLMYRRGAESVAVTRDAAGLWTVVAATTDTEDPEPVETATGTAPTYEKAVEAARATKPWIELTTELGNTQPATIDDGERGAWRGIAVGVQLPKVFTRRMTMRVDAHGRVQRRVDGRWQDCELPVKP